MKQITTLFEQFKKGSEEIISANEFRNLLAEKKTLRVKFGADPTAPDIHLGHTVVLNKLRQFQDAGHRIVFIIGDFTARIGDPSGRSETRNVPDDAQIDRNSRTYTAQVFKILDKSKTEVLYNSSWFNAMTLREILGLSSFATVAQMLARADFKARFTQGRDISILEFLYPLLQGYDSVQVKADIEIGGTDQKFNLLMGRQIQKAYNMPQQTVITLPLLEGTDGVKKMSKTYGNYIGINDAAAEIFGKIMSINDQTMMRYYELLTDIPKEDIETMHPKEAKTRLAETLTARFHSGDEASRAKEEFERVFSQRRLPSAIEVCRINRDTVLLVDILVAAGLASGRNEAKRLIKAGAVTLDSEKIVDQTYRVIPDREYILKTGKRGVRKVSFL